jgi:hypothetical protein
MAAPEPQRRRVAIPSFDLTDSDESELEEDAAAGPQQPPSREGVDKHVRSPPTIAGAGAPAPPASAPASDGASRIKIPSFDIDDSSDDSGATESSAPRLPHGQSQQAGAIETLDSFSARALLYRSQPPGVFPYFSAAGSRPSAGMQRSEELRFLEDSAHGNAVQRKSTLGGEEGGEELVEEAACPICNAMFAITDLPYHVEEEMAALCMPGDEEWRKNTRGLGRSQDQGFGVVHQDRPHIFRCPVALAPHTQYTSTATSSLLTPSTVSREARRKDVDSAQMQSGREEGKNINTGPGRFKMKVNGRMEERGQPDGADSARSRVAGRDIHTEQDIKTGPGRRGNTSSRVGTCTANSIVASTRANAASVGLRTHKSVHAAHFYSTPPPLPHFHAPRAQLHNAPPADAGGGGREGGPDWPKGTERESGVDGRGVPAQDAVLSRPGEPNEAEAGSGQLGFRDKRFGWKDLRWSNIWSRLDFPAPRSAPRAPHSACKQRTSNAANGGGAGARHGGDGIAASVRRAGGMGCEHDRGVPGTLETGRPEKTLLAAWMHSFEADQGPAVKPRARGAACGCDTIPCSACKY